MKKDYSREFKLFIVQEALETKNIKRFLKIEGINKSTFYTWLKKYKDTGTVANFSTKPKTSPNIFNNQEAINLCHGAIDIVLLLAIIFLILSLIVI